MTVKKNPKPISLERQIAAVLMQKHGIVESNRMSDGSLDLAHSLWKEVEALDATVATLNALRQPLEAKIGLQLFPEPTCTTCGCTEFVACWNGCSWTTLDKKTNAGVCTSCKP